GVCYIDFTGAIAPIRFIAQTPPAASTESAALHCYLATRSRACARPRSSEHTRCNLRNFFARCSEFLPIESSTDKRHEAGCCCDKKLDWCRRPGCLLSKKTTPPWRDVACWHYSLTWLRILRMSALWAETGIRARYLDVAYDPKRHFVVAD